MGFQVPQRPEDALGIMRSMDREINHRLNNIIARPMDAKNGYDPYIESFCKEQISYLDAIEKTHLNDGEVLLMVNLLKAQLYGNWQPMISKRGNEKEAVNCYERALAIARNAADPVTQAEVYFRYACILKVGSLGIGDKKKAKEFYNQAVQLAGAGSEVGQRAQQAMANMGSGCLGVLVAAIGLASVLAWYTG